MRHEKSHPSSGRKLSVTILLNIGLTAAEIIGGIMTGYLALLADAIHNLSDVAALLLAYFGEVGSRTIPTKRTTYGLKRMEVMTAFISAVSLVVIAIYIFYEAYQRFLHPVGIRNPSLLLIVALVALIGNAVSVYILYPSRKHTLNVRAAFLHMFYDTLSSLAVIIGAVVILYSGWTYLDPILSVLIGLMILWSSGDVIREATMILMEAVPSRIDYDQVKTAIKEHPLVVDVHDLHIWSLSSSSVALSCHIELKNEDYNFSPQVINDLSRMLHNRFGINHSTIQPEKGSCVSGDLAGKPDEGVR
jgi:cobalt-zinc-cadmium efflux system protein